MREGWEKKKLNEFCEFSNGLWTGKKPPFQTVGVIRNTNFTKDCLLDDSDVVFLEVEQSQFQKRKLEYGDIILEKSGGGPKQPVGRVVTFNKVEGHFSFSNFTSVIRVKDKNEVDYNFLHRFLFMEYISGATEKMQSHSTGIRNLKFDEYKAIEIPLPPLPEQQRIVAILDEAFASIAKAKANAEQNLKNAKELFESYLQGVFENKGEGWEEKRFEELIQDHQIGLIKSTREQGRNKEYRYLKMDSITSDNNLRHDRYVYVDADASELEKFRLNEGDFLFNTRNSYELVGKTCVFIPIDEEPTLFNNNIMRVVFKKGISSHFINYAFSTELLKKRLLNLKSGTTSVVGIYYKGLKDLKIPIVAHDEQQTIVRQLDTLRVETQKLEAVYQKKIADLEELKKSILQKAFAGELTDESIAS
jgi:type I restriction enzyme S subunit